MDLIWKALKDLKEPAILVRLFIPFAAGLVLVSLMGYGLFGVLLTSDMVTHSPVVQNFESWKMQAEGTIGSIPVIGGLILWFLGAIVMVVAGVLGVILGSYLILIFAMIITGFMTDSLVKVVRDKHYPGVEYEGHGSTLGSIWMITKFSLAMVLLLLLTLPLMFIPLVNVVWFWLIGFLFFRYAMVMDIGQIILPEAQFDKLKPVSNWQPTTAVGLIFASSIFPMMSFFAPIIAVLALSHYYLDKCSLEGPARDESTDEKA